PRSSAGSNAAARLVTSGRRGPDVPPLPGGLPGDRHGCPSPGGHAGHRPRPESARLLRALRRLGTRVYHPPPRSPGASESPHDHRRLAAELPLADRELSPSPRITHCHPAHDFAVEGGLACHHPDRDLLSDEGHRYDPVPCALAPSLGTA